jgi:hypothetical protein
MEFYGYELHAHPDLLDLGVLDRLVSNPVTFVAAYGLPALAHPNGLIFAFAFGVDYVYFRDVQIDGGKVIDRLGPSWEGMDIWLPPEWATQTIAERLAHKKASQARWMEEVRKIASEAYERAAGWTTG